VNNVGKVAASPDHQHLPCSSAKASSRSGPHRCSFPKDSLACPNFNNRALRWSSARVGDEHETLLFGTPCLGASACTVVSTAPGVPRRSICRPRTLTVQVRVRRFPVRGSDQQTTTRTMFRLSSCSRGNEPKRPLGSAFVPGERTSRSQDCGRALRSSLHETARRSRTKKRRLLPWCLRNHSKRHAFWIYAV